MKYTLIVDMDTVAFEENPDVELARILLRERDRVLTIVGATGNPHPIKIFDQNKVLVGTAQLSDRDGKRIPDPEETPCATE